MLQAQETALPAAGQKKHSLMALFWGADYRLEARGGEGTGALAELRSWSGPRGGRLPWTV